MGVDKLAYVNLKRIPVRIVHAKWAWAFGFFEVAQGEGKGGSSLSSVNE